MNIYFNFYTNKIYNNYYTNKHKEKIIIIIVLSLWLIVLKILVKNIETIWTIFFHSQQWHRKKTKEHEEKLGIKIQWYDENNFNKNLNNLISTNLLVIKKN